MHRGQWGTGFGDEELQPWAERIAHYTRQGADVYIYFNNDPDGQALRDAERLRAMLQA